VAGPNRPPLPKPPPPPKAPLITWGKPPEEPVKVAPKPNEVLPKRTAVRKQTAPLRDAREREDAYTEMRQAAAERGNYLDNLGDQLNAVSVSAGNYLSQAKNAAVGRSVCATVKYKLTRRSRKLPRARPRGCLASCCDMERETTWQSMYVYSIYLLCS
jgi:hypothetical protein